MVRRVDGSLRSSDAVNELGHRAMSCADRGRRPGVGPVFDPQVDVASSGPVPFVSLPAVSSAFDDADAAECLENLRAVIKRWDSALHAELDRWSQPHPRMLVGDEPRDVVTVTPPLNNLDKAVFRWGTWGHRIAPVSAPAAAAVLVLAEIKARGRS